MKRPGKLAKYVADWHLWRELSKSVSPLRSKQTDPVRSGKGRGPAPEQQTYAGDRKMPSGTEGAVFSAQNVPNRKYEPPTRRPVPDVSAPDNVMDRRLRRKIARGHADIEATLDLHGMREYEAKTAVVDFIISAHERGLRNLLIITGKGARSNDITTSESKGVLRLRTPGWLGEPVLSNLIVSIDQAVPRHGGGGALYVRLRRKRT